MGGLGSGLKVLVLLLTVSSLLVAQNKTGENSIQATQETKKKRERMSIQLSKDLDLIIMGLNGYKFKNGGYPHNDMTCSFNSKINSGGGEWNETNFYISKEVGSRWSYETITNANFNGEQKPTRGNIVVKPSPKYFNLLKKKEIADILKTKCLDIDKEIRDNPMSKAYSEDALECILLVGKILHY